MQVADLKMQDKVTKSFALIANVVQIIVILLGGLYFMFQVKADLEMVQHEQTRMSRDIDKIVDFLGIWHNGNRSNGGDLPPRREEEAL